MSEELEELLETLKYNIPEDYIRSCDTSDGIGYYEIDTESWQYKLYYYVNKLKSEKLDLIKWLESKNQFHYKNGKIEDNYILVSEVLDYIRR